MEDYSNKQVTWDEVFGEYNYELTHGIKLMPYEYFWEEEKEGRELNFKVSSKILETTKKHFLITIEIEEEFEIYPYNIGSCSSWENFAKVLYHSLENSKFLSNFFLLDNSYIKIKNNQYSPERNIKKISLGFYDDIIEIEERMKNLYLEEIKGDLLILEDETDSLISYDGSGIYCKEIDGKIYKSSIVFDPDILSEYFTHVEWFNR